jgi:high affinity sulfate transporter 1
VARRYRRAWLRHDLVAGVVLTALLVPQGVAYAELAGLPAVTGLYATLVPLLAYAVMGPSRIMVLGPDSALAPLVAATVVPLAAADPTLRVELAGLLAVLVGALLIAGGIARLGFLTDLLSKPVRVGYLAGVTATVVVGQLPQLLGFAVESGNVFEELWGLVTGLDAVDLTTAAIGAACVTVILVARRVAPVVPGVLIAVVASTLLVKLGDLSVAVIGEVPSGLPSFTIPTPSVEDLGRLTLGAMAIALLAFADTSVLSRSYASRLGERVDQSQELTALGLANLATGLFQGFPMSSSSSRTPVAEAAGARTQLTGVVAAALLGVVLVAGTDLLADIPKTALAAVVITAVMMLVDVPAMRWLWAVNRGDFALAMASFVGVVAFGILPGVGIAIGLSIVAVLERAWHPYSAVLGRVRGLKGYHDVVRHPEGRQVPGLLLFRFDAPLFFANAEVFRDGVHRAIAEAVAPVRRVVVAAEPITEVDSTAADVLAELVGELDRQGIELAFAEMKGPVKDRLRRYGLFDQIGGHHFYATVGVAVRSYVHDQGVEWRDWEEEH